MKTCKTCEEIEFWLNNKSDILDYKLFVKFSQYGWYKSDRKVKGKQKSTLTSKAFDLNYCPTCGKKIEKLESKDEKD